jgi:zinc transporter ZupT
MLPTHNFPRGATGASRLRQRRGAKLKTLMIRAIGSLSALV